MNVKKTLLSFYTFFVIFILIFTVAYAEKPELKKIEKVEIETKNKILEEQLKKSKADTLNEKLPDEVSQDLKSAGVSRVDWRELIHISPKRVFLKILSMIKKISPRPFKCMFYVLSVIFICALMDTLKTPLKKSDFTSTLSVVSSLCISVTTILPLLSFIEKTTKIIGASSIFMLSYVPILAAIMLSSGQAVTAGSYQLLMLSASEVIAQVSSNLLIPMTSSFLAISFVSAISNRINISGVCYFFYRVIKWTLSLSMTTFVGLLTLQSLVGVSADNIGSKAAKFMISSFVPVVGGALSDAFSTVQSSIKLLKSSVGAFGIIAVEFIFLPVILEALLWLVIIYFCSAISSIFSLKKVSELLNNSARVVSMVLSIIICCLILLTVSSVIVLTITNNTS
ncbi:MAG: stage III sporulation protein AE [Oscillospiraceae bacterium]|jgi:stage III sporulation protein AE|nr:stage III sporulation protein AE [Oscillospiraceae bacterium]